MKLISKWAVSALVVLALAAVGGLAATFLMHNQDSEAASAKTTKKKTEPKTEKTAAKADAPAGPGWATTCQAGPNGGQICAVSQIAAQTFQTNQGNQTLQLLKTQVYYGPDGKPQINFVVPLGTVIPNGLTIQVDDQKPYTISLATCLQAGCQAGLAMDAAALDNLGKSKQATVSYSWIVSNKMVNVKAPIVLAGLSQALSKLPQPAAPAPSSSN